MSGLYIFCLLSALSSVACSRGGFSSNVLPSAAAQTVGSPGAVLTSPGNTASPHSTPPAHEGQPTPEPFAPIDTSSLPPNGDMSQPWRNSETSIIIDAYEGNSIDWKLIEKDPRVAGVIHRASTGLTVDSAYASRKDFALADGYLWGAYHIGTSDDPVAQAHLFLQTVGNDPKTLWALDLENTTAQGMMDSSGAEVFLQTVYQMTGRIMVVYANNSVTLDLNQKLAGDALIHRAKLWYARFVPTIASFPSGIWSDYFLWQFSSEINCRKTGTCVYNVPGTRYDIDVDVFYGTRDELAGKWAN